VHFGTYEGRSITKQHHSVSFPNINEKFELMLMRRVKAVPVHAMLIYKYQIFYLDRITIVVWRQLVNDIDLCRSARSLKNP